MYSSFFGLNVGQQGLYSARTALNVTNHNIANIETKGYSRQYQVQRATEPMGGGTRGMIGTGSEIIDVKRHRDEYLDHKYWGMSGKLGEYEVKGGLMKQIETVLDEPSDNGFSKYYENVFKSLETLSKNPNDKTSKISFVDNIKSFSSYINDLGNRLLEVQKDANFGVLNIVNRINHDVKQISLINHQISTIELHGNSANDLRDERSRIVDELSKTVNVETVKYKDQNGKEHFRMSIDGQFLVEDTTVNYLETRPRKVINNPEDSPDMLDIFWKSGKELYVDNDNLTGELKGYIDIRDGNNEANFRGKVVSSTGNTLVLTGLNRTDIKTKGELNIDGKIMLYRNATYDKNSGNMTFELGFDDNVDGQKVSVDDIYGDEFAGVVTKVSDSEIRITNLLNQRLEQRGTVRIGDTYYTYTSYEKNSTTNEITLKCEMPTGIDGKYVKQGDTIDYKGVPHYISKINKFVRTIAKTFNDINKQGRNGKGVNLFVYKGYDGMQTLDDDKSYENMNCHNFTINKEVLKNADLVEHTRDKNNPESDNELTLEYTKLRHDKSIFAVGEPENFWHSIIGEVGIDSKDCEQLHKGRENLIHLIDNRRMSVSGVEINEEVSNLMKYQQAYSMAAKIISTMDEIYDITINRMGM